MLSNPLLLKKILSKKPQKSLWQTISNSLAIKTILERKKVPKHSTKMHLCQNLTNLWIRSQLVAITTNLEPNSINNQSGKPILTCLSFQKGNSNLRNKNNTQCFKNWSLRLRNWDFLVCRIWQSCLSKILIILTSVKSISRLWLNKQPPQTWIRVCMCWGFGFWKAKSGVTSKLKMPSKMVWLKSTPRKQLSKFVT